MITHAETIAAACQANGEFRAGGIDVQERRNRGLSTGPLIDISRLPYNSIEWKPDGSAVLGALLPISRIAADTRIASLFPGLALAAASVANPQVRAVATLGGNLLQRNQCPYFRHPAFNCYKRGGDGCPARADQQQPGVLFDLGPCIHSHPSTLGMALLDYDATIVVSGGQQRTISELYGSGADHFRDHLLEDGAILTHIILPPPLEHEHAAYFRAISRATAEWPLVEVLARLQTSADGRITAIWIAAGGIANIPLRLTKVEAALIGQQPTAQNLAHAANLAATGANPLPQTRYKAELLAGTVLEALERALVN